MKILSKKPVTAATYISKSNQLRKSWIENLTKLGFVEAEVDTFVVVASNSKDMVVYDAKSGSLNIYTNAAGTDNGNSFIEASLDMDTFNTFLQENNCEQINTTLEDVLGM